MQPQFATATPSDLWLRWAEDLGALRGLETSIGDRLVATCEELAARYLRNGDALFARRIAEGRIRDGPATSGRTTCSASTTDLASSVASMTTPSGAAPTCSRMWPRSSWTSSTCRPDLAERFSERYRAVSGDTWPTPLEHHYVAARAADLARSAAVRAQRSEGDVRDDELTLVRAYAMTAARHLLLGQPKLILVGGSPTGGRPAVARGLRDRGNGVLLEGPAAPDDVDDGCDTDRETREYDDLLETAEQWLRTGESVVIDATWERPVDRLAARRTAERLGAGVIELLCDARPETFALREDADDDVTAGARGPETEAVEPAGGEPDMWPEAVVLDTDSTEPRVLDIAGHVIEHRLG